MKRQEEEALKKIMELAREGGTFFTASILHSYLSSIFNLAHTALYLKTKEEK